ncbi:MAG: endolytic transglycosylase MltG [Chloroflexota bacterium]
MKTDRSVAPRRARPVLGQPTYVAPRYHSNIWGRLIFLLLILALVGAGGGVGVGLWAIHRAQGTSSAPVAVHVHLGDTVTTIADRLQRRGVIDNALLFRLDARVHHLNSTLKVGDYALRRNMSIDEMVAALALYRQRYIEITIREGLRKEQIAAILQAHGIDARSFLQEANHPTLRIAILADRPRTLEGYLFPNTYKVIPKSSGRLFADGMVRQLNSLFTPRMRAQARAHGFSIFQALTLASIVEREARVPSERGLIAGVYANRLRLHMFMDADPTVQYALGSPSKWWPVISLQDYQLRAAYNTYIHLGLPPGPIANPGLGSIQAAVNPVSTPYLYFVARGGGRHIFARSLAEQNANIAKYQH